MTDRKKPRALIVEDSTTMAAAYSTLLADRFDVVVANSRADASDTLRAVDDLAVILCDYILEDGLGTDVLKEAAQSNPTAATALITAHGSLELAQETINHSLAHRFLVKGGPLTDVLTVADDCLAHHKAAAGRVDANTIALDGAVASLVEAVCVQEPRLRGMSARLSTLVATCAASSHDLATRDLTIASLVSSVGLLKVPFWITRRVLDGKPIAPRDARAFRLYPKHTADMIRFYPSLSGASDILEKLAKPPRRPSDPETMTAVALLRACNDATWLVERVGVDAAISVLLTDARGDRERSRRDALERAVSALRHVSGESADTRYLTLSCGPGRLLPDDVLAEDLLDAKGRLLLARGGKLTAKMIENLRTTSKLKTHCSRLSIIRPAGRANRVPAVPAPSE